MVEKTDPVNAAFLNDEGLTKMKNTLPIEKVSIDQYDAVFVPGGLAPVIDILEGTI